MAARGTVFSPAAQLGNNHHRPSVRVFFSKLKHTTSYTRMTDLHDGGVPQAVPGAECECAVREGAGAAPQGVQRQRHHHRIRTPLQERRSFIDTLIILSFLMSLMILIISVSLKVTVGKL
jgi:hypothetical protein